MQSIFPHTHHHHNYPLADLSKWWSTKTFSRHMTFDPTVREVQEFQKYSVQEVSDPGKNFMETIKYKISFTYCLFIINWSQIIAIKPMINKIKQRTGDWRRNQFKSMWKEASLQISEQRFQTIAVWLSKRKDSSETNFYMFSFSNNRKNHEKCSNSFSRCFSRFKDG